MAILFTDQSRGVLIEAVAMLALLLIGGLFAYLFMKCFKNATVYVDGKGLVNRTVYFDNKIQKSLKKLYEFMSRIRVKCS